MSLNIDVANLPREAIERLVELAPSQGRVVISHAFGDFRREDMDDLAVQLYQYGFRLIHCPAWPHPNQRGRLKSVVDDVMAQDLRDQLEYAPQVDVFILGSGDRNFIAVANALKRHRKRVVVAADQESINRELRLCADEYLALPRSRGSRGRPPSTPLPEAEPDLDLPSDPELLDQIRRLAATRDYVTLRTAIRALLPSGIGDERTRAALAERIQALMDAGDIRSERRLIKGRIVNTLVVAAEHDVGSIHGEDGCGAAQEQSDGATTRRRPRRKAGISTSS